MPGGDVKIDFGAVNGNLDAMLGHLEGDVRKDAMRAVVDEATKRAQENCPVLTGALQASITGTVAEDGASGTVETVGVHYAAAVHEDLDAQHAQGGAKFIERAVVGVGSRTFLQTIARTVEEKGLLPQGGEENHA